MAGAIIRLGEPQEFTTPALADTTWFYDESTETTVEFIDDSQIIAVRLPAQVLSEFGISDSAQLLQLRYDDGLVGPTRAFLESTLNLDSQLPSVSRYFLEKLVHEMVGGIILENMGVSKSGTTRRSLFEQSIAYIAATTGDPELTPLKLATELSVSLRQLQREFKRQGLTIASSIKQNRIDLAVRLLQDPKFMVLSIEKIAEHSGFTSLVQLRRALQAAGLGNPTDLRVSSGQQTI
ncbi:helix-turn-helix domain-containing protein [Arthrobacter sp. MYb227]|uniref:helix-turn-helix domain-containing protein n=1 Tax=Arthrobacter sp. MYb227 TaxID=1848601 RepID=UPI001C612B99|nr:helix-turn-helix domain-containing protein [Arthrobacter sp. MYb227]